MIFRTMKRCMLDNEVILRPKKTIKQADPFFIHSISKWSNGLFN